MNDYFKYFLLLITFSCNAQNPIINLSEDDGTIIQNSYIKDTNNDLNPFIGTYIYNDGNVYFKVVLKKIVMSYNQRYYEDIIVGEMQYSINGVDMFNSLNDIDTNFPNQAVQHSIGGNSILQNLYKPLCNDCMPNEKRLRLMFDDNRAYGDVIIQRITVGGNNAIKFEPRTSLPTRSENDPIITRIIPNITFIMIKQ